MLDEGRITGIARLDVAIARIADAAVADGLCEAVLLKGSIARGDADEFSDIDLYLVVSPQNRDIVLAQREKYLAACGDIVFVEDVDFGLPQKLAIFSDALHVDLYVAEPQQVGSLDPVVAIYDPAGLFADVAPVRSDVTDEELCRHFSSALYCLVEASSAYGRGNDAWAAKIMSDAAGELSVLVRSLYDRRYAFLVNADDGLASKLDARFLTWAKEGLGALLFAERGNVPSADVPITSPRTYEEFCEGLDSGEPRPIA